MLCEQTADNSGKPGREKKTNIKQHKTKHNKTKQNNKTHTHAKPNVKTPQKPFRPHNTSIVQYTHGTDPTKRVRATMPDRKHDILCRRPRRRHQHTQHTRHQPSKRFFPFDQGRGVAKPIPTMVPGAVYQYVGTRRKVSEIRGSRERSRSEDELYCRI